MNWDDVPTPNRSVWWGQMRWLSKRLETDTSPLRWSAVALGCFAENTTCYRIDGSKGNQLIRFCQENIILY